MKIDSQNIEEYLFDYFEGNLTVSEKEQVELFVDANPTYSADFEAWKKATVVEPEIVFPDAHKLRIEKSWFDRYKMWLTSMVLALLGAGVTSVSYFNTQEEPQQTTTLIENYTSNHSMDSHCEIIKPGYDTYGRKTIATNLELALPTDMKTNGIKPRRSIDPIQPDIQENMVLRQIQTDELLASNETKHELIQRLAYKKNVYNSLIQLMPNENKVIGYQPFDMDAAQQDMVGSKMRRFRKLEMWFLRMKHYSGGRKSHFENMNSPSSNGKYKGKKTIKIVPTDFMTF